MKKLLFFTLFLAATLGNAQVPATFWGLHILHNSTYPPNNGSPIPNFKTFRLWDTGTGWGDIEGNNSVQGCNNSSQIDFTKFDSLLTAYVVPNGFDVIYTISKTPCFISANPTDANCSYYNGSCVPPTDLTCSGTGVAGTGGSDATFKTYMQALWSHIVSKVGILDASGISRSGTNPMARGSGTTNGSSTTTAAVTLPGRSEIIVRVAADVRQSVGGGATNVHFLTPAIADAINQVQAGGWWYQYLSLGGGTYADVMSVHGYLSGNPVESICCATGTLVANTLATMQHFNQSGKPLFLSEAYCGQHCPTGDPALVGWVGRYYTLVLSQAQVARSISPLP